MNRRVAVPLRQDALELDTRGDVELGEDLAQVVFGRTRADVEAVAAALDCGDKGAAATRPGMPGEVTPL
jgi:hypothetical protein